MPAIARVSVLILTLVWSVGSALAESSSTPPPASPNAESPAVAPNVAISNVTQNSFQVRWEPIAGASRFELSYGTDSVAANRGTMFLTTMSQQFTNLLPNTTYHVKVRAIAGGRAGAWSTIKSASTQIPVMTDLTADDVRDSTAHLTWSGMYSDLVDTVYEISYGTDPDASSDGLVSSLKNFATLKNLSPESTYYIKLRVRNPHVIGPWSTPISITTLPFSPGVAPTEVTGLPQENGGLKLTWRSLAEADSYDVAYGTDPVAENMGIVPAATNQFVIQSAPNTRYYFKVRGVIKGNSSPWSVIKNTLTLPSAPRGLIVSRQSSNAAVASWKSLSGANIARFYHVSWGTDAQGTNLGVTVTTNSEYILEGLKSDQKHFVRVRTANTTGTSQWSEVYSFKTLPAGVTQLKLVDVQHTTAKIEWTEIDNVTTYELSFNPVSTNELQKPFSLEFTKPPAELRDLKPDQTYQAKIRVLFPNHQPGAWSNFITFTTFAVPEMPAQLTLAHIDGTYVQLTWTAMETVTTYEIVVSPDEFSEQGISQISNRPEAKISSLPENTQLFVKVRSRNMGGPGPWSSSVAFSTLPAVSPQNLTVSHTSSTECLLTWNRIPGTALTTYELRFAPEKEAWRTIANYPAQTFGLEKLIPDTDYRVQVRAKNPTDFGPWSSEITFHTPPLPPAEAPKDLRAETVTDISARLLWRAMPKISGYRLSLGTDLDASNLSVETLTQTEYACKSLIPEKSYFAKIRAFNATGDGPWSETLLISTLPSPPISAPESVETMDILTTSFSVVWKPAQDAFAYEVGISTDPRAESAEIKTAPSYIYAFTDLQPKTKYYVRVRKVNRGGSGPWCQVRTVTTLAP